MTKDDVIVGLKCLKRVRTFLAVLPKEIEIEVLPHRVSDFYYEVLDDVEEIQETLESFFVVDEGCGSGHCDDCNSAWGEGCSDG